MRHMGEMGGWAVPVESVKSGILLYNGVEVILCEPARTARVSVATATTAASERPRRHVAVRVVPPARQHASRSQIQELSEKVVIGERVVTHRAKVGNDGESALAHPLGRPLHPRSRHPLVRRTPDGGGCILLKRWCRGEENAAAVLWRHAERLRVGIARRRELGGGLVHPFKGRLVARVV